ncbi:MAG: T9SS type A sorting domain-containing protein [Candidatus Cloacimonetes bacterium]|nr:T9SS type A sorting domain-containing protein [Candidatus Cloacimonadota bacterium]
MLVLFSSTVFAQNYDLNFGGTDWIEIPDNPALNPSELTVEFWINPASLTGIPNFVTKGGNYGGFTPQYEIYHSQTNHCLRYISGNSGQSPNLNSISSLSTGVWQHVVLTHTETTIKFYIDGILDSQTTSGGFLANPTTQTLHFGVEGRKLSNTYLNGKLDEIRIWDAALDQTTIQTWMNQPLNDTHPNWSDLVGYWKLDEGSGQVAGDSSGNGNDGQLGSTGAYDGNDPSWGLSDNPLPVVLSSFTAIQTQANFAQINWTTQSETDLYGYNVYRNVESEINSSFKLNSTILEAENTPTGSDYSFTDENVEFEQIYYYWLESVDLGGNTEFFGPISITLEDNNQIPELPNETLLQSAYPNPFNPKTTINFSVKENETAQLIIYNAKGQIVKTYPVFENGTHTINWLGKDENENDVGSGVFFYRLKSASTTQIKKMLLLK